AYLAERLPGHMVPSGIVVLDQLPLTDNGKVDRRRLPDLEVKGPAAGRTLPRNPLEQELAAVWSEVLGIGGIRVEDNFFDLGGHSLRAMQLITRLRRRFQVELSLREFLSSPTISDLAVAILQKKAEKVQGDEMLRLLEEVERMPATATPPSRSM
ncbi:MAG TPA: phosphopantetheine-binding protein, partial [Thermoanaerobaculia bacterium]|nr:phosphopantetheine-binding protein [Thermoanaerobaculia bacterium]